jgi:hypothetical protein
VATTVNESGRRPVPAGRRSRVSFQPCDHAMHRALEAKVREELKRAPREEDGIVYTEMNSGCAALRVPIGPATRP